VVTDAGQAQVFFCFVFLKDEMGVDGMVVQVRYDVESDNAHAVDYQRPEPRSLKEVLKDDF